ncbi:Holliday junction branch migration protein RuvA [Actinomyces gaoshouyii]|uniref:Holliday junction branch migration protein RuvA n=1 Tax=Actinomyces gaoshouyii TaxID=1960083 RepID=UPI0009BE6C9E|nr:Holliday junction branch migration protein RuvA [Actinomyces gaoshouyii]ARD41629.1 Holliday junction branch migration protein RuvA [Actinomyces gaoshouyii]
MISSLRGTVTAVTLTSAVIEIGGVGMTVLATPTTLSSLRVGAEALLHTELIVREDSLTLYGFADADERDCFRVLLGAKGVGAKLALAMLAVHTPDALRRAIAAEDVAALKRVPGLGPKGAQRIIIDVGDKLGPPLGQDPSASRGAPGAADGAAEDGEPHPDVVAALIQLGWNEASARDAVLAVEPGLTAPGQTPAVPEILRAALKWLGGGRRG